MLARVRPAVLAAALAALAAVSMVGAAGAAAGTPAPEPGTESESTVTSEPADPSDAQGSADLVSFGISPSGPERPDERPYLTVRAAPGSTVYDHVALLNQDDQPIGLQVYAGDVIMADGGGLAVTTRDQGSTRSGSWITVTGPTDIEVPAQTRERGIGYVVVPFSITIPANAEPGDHIAGVVASLISVGSGGEGAPSIELEQRVAARVYIRVDGELVPGLEVVDVSASWQPGAAAGLAAGSVSVTYTLRNTGNQRMAVEPEVEVAGPFGWATTSATGTRVDELMPGGEVTATAVVEDVWPLLRETVTVRATPVAAAGGEAPDLATAESSITLTVVPWAYLGLVILLLVLLALGLLRGRASRRRAGTRRGRAAPSATAAPAVAPAAPLLELAEPVEELQPVGRHRR